MSDETPLPDLWAIDLAQVESAVLRRLIAEVRDALADERALEPLDGAPELAPGSTRGQAPQMYDRIHNRYNRQRGHPYDRVHNRHNRGR